MTTQGDKPLADRLAELADLHEAEVLSDEEFVAATTRLLSGRAPSPERSEGKQDTLEGEPAPGPTLPTGEEQAEALAGPARTSPPSGPSEIPVAASLPRVPRRRRRPIVVATIGLPLLLAAAVGIYLATRGPSAERVSGGTSPSSAVGMPTPTGVPSVSPTISVTQPSDSGSATPTTDSTTPSEFAAAVWPEAAEENIRTRLERHCPGEPCRNMILRLGGSEAAKFYERTGLVLVGTYPAGSSVDIGFVIGELGTNVWASGVVLGGTPQMMFPDEHVAGISLAGDRTYRKLLALHPQMILWPSEALVEPPVVLDDGGSEVTYQYPLLDGCHACDQVGSARMTFKFGPDGTYLGVSTAGICGAYSACPVSIDTSSPVATSATTPKEAVSMLVAAWTTDNKDAAFEVGSARAVEFMWNLPPRSKGVAAGRCHKSDTSDEYWCSLGGFMDDGTGVFGVPGATVVKASSGFFVADAEWYADA